VDKLNHFEQDRILARRAALDREELVANLMQFKRHDKSDVMVNHLLERYSQQASDQSTKVESPLLLWNTQDDNTPLISEDLLGRGAYGVVFKSTWLGWNCAKKVFMGAENVSFKKEADILAALKHPNIIQLFCCTTDAKSCSLVMELMSTDLRNLMDDRMLDPDHVPFSLPVAVDIMLQVARGLKYMHEQQVGHRDIKSSNILANPTSVPELTEMGYVDVKVADFGLAKAKLMSLTATMQTKDIGTTQYRAPELYTQVSHKLFFNHDW
jgi:serine/threonine protein kinase